MDGTWRKKASVCPFQEPLAVVPCSPGLQAQGCPSNRDRSIDCTAPPAPALRPLMAQTLRTLPSSPRATLPEWWGGHRDCLLSRTECGKLGRHREHVCTRRTHLLRLPAPSRLRSPCPTLVYDRLLPASRELLPASHPPMRAPQQVCAGLGPEPWEPSGGLGLWAQGLCLWTQVCFQAMHGDDETATVHCLRAIALCPGSQERMTF